MRAKNCFLSLLTLVGVMLVSNVIAEEKDATKEKAVPAALAFQVKSLDGKDVDLSKYQGKVALVVNVASYCGNTGQYESLEALNKKYGEKGLAVLGFPCNQFGGQEPDSAEKIQAFCTKEYGVTFDLFEKVDVNGDKATPFYQHLTAVESQPEGKGKVKWNFEKFLIGRNGEVVARFAHNTQPDAPEVVKAIEAELEKK